MRLSGRFVSRQANDIDGQQPEMERNNLKTFAEVLLKLVANRMSRNAQMKIMRIV
jgi:hypothetical protein